MHQREIVAHGIRIRAQVVRPVEQLRRDRGDGHEVADPDFTSGLWFALLNVLAIDDDVQPGLGLERPARLVERYGLLCFRIHHPLLYAGAIALVEQMKVYPAIFDCGTQLDRDLMLRYGQLSLPDGSSASPSPPSFREVVPMR